MQGVMKGRESRRLVVLERLADHVLQAGLQGASLRPLAAAAGTSDRMLLYYFADKDELLAATLGLLAQRLQALLDSSRTTAAPYEILLPGICATLDSPAIRPYMRLWLELAAFSARGEEPFRTVTVEICDGFLAWCAARLQVDREADRMSMAALLLGTVEGLLLLNAIGRRDTADAALRGAALRIGQA